MESMSRQQHLEYLMLIPNWPLAELSERLEKHVPLDSDRVELARDLEFQAVKLLRLSEYIGARGEGQDHSEAVKEQNRTITKIRKALGYTYPKDDLNF